MNPVYHYSTSHKKKIYLVDFRDFHYSLVINQQDGFEISISLDKPITSFESNIKKGDISDRLHYCLKWVNHIKQKVINLEQEFKYYHISLKGNHSFCAISDSNKISFIGEQQQVSPKNLIKTLKLSNINSHALTYQRRSRESRKVIEIDRWECMKGWGNIEVLLKAMKIDLQRITKLDDYPVFTEQRRNEISRVCQQHKIPYQNVKDLDKVGVKIANRTFFNFNAAQNYAYALIEEKVNHHEPSYDLHLDKLKI